MGPFDYAVGLISIIVGLALADVASSLHKLLRRRHSVRWDGRVILSVAYVLLKITGMWFAVWSIRGVKEVLWFPFYLSLFLEFMLLFLVCAACLPDEEAEGRDLAAFYQNNRRYLWSLFALFQISYFLHWIYFVGIRVDRHELLLRGADTMAPLAIYLLLATIQSRWLHYVGLALLLVFIFCSSWGQTLAL